VGLGADGGCSRSVDISIGINITILIVFIITF
jgi:hypothetical protein